MNKIIIISIIAVGSFIAFNSYEANPCNNHTAHNGYVDYCNGLQVKYGSDGVKESYRYKLSGAVAKPSKAWYSDIEVMNIIKNANSLRKEVM